jgi:hypothetical protein
VKKNYENNLDKYEQQEAIIGDNRSSYTISHIKILINTLCIYARKDYNNSCGGFIGFETTFSSAPSSFA